MPGAPDSIERLVETFPRNIDFFPVKIRHKLRNEKQIVRLVKQLFGLTYEKIRIVGGKEILM